MIDLIFTVGSLVLLVGLAPTVFDPNARISLMTSVPTAIVLFVYAVTFGYMGLVFSSISSTITCVFWTIIAFENRHRKKP